MILTVISLILFTHQTTVLGFSANTVYFQTTGLSVFEYYPNVQLFEVTVPQSVNTLQWDFFINRNAESCPPSLIKFHYQHGSFPLVRENNKTFPDNYRLARTAAANFTLVGRAVYTINVTSPFAGRWLAGAYVDRLNNHKVVKNLGAQTCTFSIQMNVTMFREDEVQEIAINEALRMKQDQEKQVYSFPLEDNIWSYTVSVDCTGDTGCPVIMYVGDGFIPHNNFTTKMMSCKDSTTACSSEVQSPRLDQLQYISIVRSNSTKPVHYTLTIVTAEFGNPSPPDHITAAPIRTLEKLSHKKKSKDKVSDPEEVKMKQNETVVEKKKPHVTNAYYTTHAQPKPTHHNNTVVKKKMINHTKNPTTTKSEQKEEEKEEVEEDQTSILYDLEQETADRRKKRSAVSVGQMILQLDRLENPDVSFRTVFSASAVLGENQLYLEEGELAAVGFTVLPSKDQGGTLFFTAQLNVSDVDTNKENVTVMGCLSPNRLTVNATSVTCTEDFAFALTLAKNDTTMLFPYPEAGIWYLVMTVQCSDGQQQQSCSEQNYPVLFEMVSTPCDRSKCGVTGSCNRYYTGPNLYSACNCEAKYRGYGCTDDHETLSPKQQLADTLLLVLSNLMFIPSIGVATARRYYTEALVYLANMIFSTLYHACDMGPWSQYRLCVMPYHVLSYCDFFSSIMSIWVTLVAAATLPPTLSSLAHMAGALSLAMAVEWHVHGLWHNVVPIAVGVLLVGISWGVRCKRMKHCYPTQKREWLCMLPGLALAGIGFGTFAFLETDANYPYTHSAWHMAMALSIIFLLPMRKREPCTIVCEDSTSSSFELDYPSESVNLVPANQIM